ncbi:MAG: MarC family protein [Methanomassiliicoccales archaeon]|nr:MarC family protein [Methanomassiliicoccales archaeon]NYT14380.1 MarC family protein [Methanomassiliicoccales archaeon]
MADLTYALEFIGGAIISIIVISNPISTSAVFIALTQGMTQDEKIRIVKKSVTYSTGILLFFALTGFLIFTIFGFSIGAFRIAGGVLLFSTAVYMLNPKPSSVAADETSRDIALIPLAIPFTAGPGTIVTVVVLMSEAQNLVDVIDPVTGILAMIGVIIGIMVTIIVSYFMMARSDKIDAALKEGGRNVVTRLMGLLVMAIAIQFIINGIKDILPEFIEIVNNAAILPLF